jgi:hypothetical protein
MTAAGRSSLGRFVLGDRRAHTVWVGAFEGSRLFVTSFNFEGVRAGRA